MFQQDKGTCHWCYWLKKSLPWPCPPNYYVSLPRGPALYLLNLLPDFTQENRKSFLNSGRHLERYILKEQRPHGSKTSRRRPVESVVESLLLLPTCPSTPKKQRDGRRKQITMFLSRNGLGRTNFSLPLSMKNFSQIIIFPVARKKRE